jgi:ferric-dicitrate binding protein FerR (iron transport regulator)
LLSFAVNVPYQALLAIMNNRAAFLVGKKLTGEISETEIQELNLQLIQNPELYETISLIEIAWKSQQSHQNTPADAGRLIKKLQHAEPGVFSLRQSDETIPQVKSWHFLSQNRFWKAAAAAVIFMLAIWWFFWQDTQNQSIAEDKAPLNQVATKAGSRTQIVLRDGTKVWLNGESKLTYANEFDGETREVRLSGEAYFDVVKNPDKPFIIHTEKITIRVTGTSFNVRDYPGETKAETSLISGKVEVCPVHNPKEVYYLKPNEKIVLKEFKPGITKPLQKQAIAEKMIRPVEVEIVKLQFDPIDNIPVETAWLNDQLAFSDESFREVADKIENWYNVSIEFRSPELESLRFTGKFDKETLPEALQALQFTTPFSYKIKDNKIFIDKN